MVQKRAPGIFEADGKIEPEAERTIENILVAGVGYTNLRDLSAGPILIERLQAGAWPPNVHIEDMSWGAVQALHWLQCHPPFDAALFIAAEPRGRPPGHVKLYRWRPPPADVAEVQSRVAEAVTGIISLDTLLTVVGHFGAMPPHTMVIEIEPRDYDWGPDLSPPVEAALREVEQRIAREALEWGRNGRA